MRSLPDKCFINRNSEKDKDRESYDAVSLDAHEPIDTTLMLCLVFVVYICFSNYRHSVTYLCERYT